MGIFLPGKTVFLKTVFVFFALTYFSACTFRNEEEIFAEISCDTEAVTYADFVGPLIERRCISCHNAVLPSGNVILEDYDHLKVYVENGRFLGAIRHDPGFANMPQGQTKLSNCEIASIEAWIEDGFPNN